MADIPKKAVFAPTWLSLPSEWDSSVSQLEMLQRLLWNVNEIIQYLEDLETAYKDYTDTAITALRQELTQKYDKAIADLKAYVDTQDAKYWDQHVKDVQALTQSVAQLRGYVDEQIKSTADTAKSYTDTRVDALADKESADIAAVTEELNRQYAALRNYLDLRIDYTLAYTDEEIRKLTDYVNDLIQQILDGKSPDVKIVIYDPTQGKDDTIQNTVNNVYDALRVFACTAQQFDSWFDDYGHTADDFRRMNLSALDYDTFSYWTMYENLIHYVTDPITGAHVNHNPALEDVSTQFRDLGLTADEFDTGLGFTGDEWADNNRSAHSWDFGGAQVYDTDVFTTTGRTPNGFARCYTYAAKKAVDDEYIFINLDPVLRFSWLAHIRPDYEVEIIPGYGGDPVTAQQFDVWFTRKTDKYPDGRDADDFKALNMSAEEYDYHASAWLYPQYLETGNLYQYTYNEDSYILDVSAFPTFVGANLTGGKIYLDTVDEPLKITSR